MDEKSCSAQQRAFDTLVDLQPTGNVFVLYGNSGSGKSTMLRKLHQELQSAFLNMKDCIDRNPKKPHPNTLSGGFVSLWSANEANSFILFNI